MRKVKFHYHSKDILRLTEDVLNMTSNRMQAKSVYIHSIFAHFTITSCNKSDCARRTDSIFVVFLEVTIVGPSMVHL